MKCNFNKKFVNYTCSRFNGKQHAFYEKNKAKTYGNVNVQWAKWKIPREKVYSLYELLIVRIVRDYRFVIYRNAISLELHPNQQKQNVYYNRCNGTDGKDELMLLYSNSCVYNEMPQNDGK